MKRPFYALKSAPDSVIEVQDVAIKHLLLGMLEIALMDAAGRGTFNYCAKASAESKQTSSDNLRRSALLWFNSGGSADEFGSFEFICLHLNLSATAIRNKVNDNKTKKIRRFYGNKGYNAGYNTDPAIEYRPRRSARQCASASESTESREPFDLLALNRDPLIH